MHKNPYKKSFSKGFGKKRPPLLSKNKTTIWLEKMRRKETTELGMRHLFNNSTTGQHYGNATDDNYVAFRIVETVVACAQLW